LRKIAFSLRNFFLFPNNRFFSAPKKRYFFWVPEK
jgi:hypothetical protein